ncbi:hypothetical protein ABH944_005166 [Caballeronia udeis]|jgi:hypothetical protein|uniref:Transposase n=1 Tax=Caballeronia udeis TaxID=1232866 RepID=A0ABW8MNS6_9BURK
MRRLHVAAARRARRVIHDEKYASKNTWREWVDRHSGDEGVDRYRATGERSFWMSKKRARHLDMLVQGHASSWRLCV